MHSESISFGAFHLDPANQCLWRDDLAIPLVPKTYAVLQYLIQHPNQLIHKEELLANVWPDEYVSEAVLKLRISELRKLLGDNPRAPSYIETVHRRGYRFIALSASVAVAPSPEFPPPAPSSQETLDRGPSPLWVGRREALSQLGAWYDRICQGDRHIVFITGPAGIGKSTLIEMFLATLDTEQAPYISHGQCTDQHGTKEAYLPLLEALGRLSRGPQAGQIVPLLQRYAPTWVRHLPALPAPPEPPLLRPHVPTMTSDLMLRELAEALEQLTTQTPLVLILEDLHWSDPETLAALTMLARRREPARLLLLGTYRPADIHLQRHPMQGVKEELALHAHCREWRMEALTEADVHAYLKARFGTGLDMVCDELAVQLHQHTGGHPLFLVQSISDLIAQDHLVQEGQLWSWHGRLDALAIGVPPSVQLFIDAQFEQLHPDRQQLLEAASVVGETFSAAAVAALLDMDVTHIDVTQIEGWCDELVSGEQFLQSCDVEQWPDGTLSGCYRFTRRLYQKAIYQRLSAAYRLRCHRRLGALLEMAFGEHIDDIAPVLAQHFEYGRQYAAAIRYRHIAGRMAMQRHAYREAVTHLDKVQELLPYLDDAQERLQTARQGQRLLAAAQMALKDDVH